jgi:hypothetical protein
MTCVHILVRGRCILFKFTQLEFEAAVFLFGRNFAEFQPGKNDFDLCRCFSMEKKTEICQISKKTISRLPDFYAKFQQVGKNIEGFCIFPTFISRM